MLILYVEDGGDVVGDSNSSDYNIFFLQIHQIKTFCKEMKLRCFLAAQTWMSTCDWLVSGISKLALEVFYAYSKYYLDCLGCFELLF